MRSAINRTIHHFLKTTTLHGFKYFLSPFYKDRVGWLLWSLASTCCAGVLCAVVWARFLQHPALLTLGDEPTSRSPTVSICYTPQRAAQLFAKHFNLTEDQILVVPRVFEKILGGKPLAREQLVFLEKLLKSRNVILSEALLQSTPDCSRITRACRLRKKMTPCNLLFKLKELTQWGVCCSANANKFTVESGTKQLQTDPDLVLLLECSDGTIPNSCEFFTKFPSEEWVSPVALTSGYEYTAQISYTAIQDTATDRLFAANCVSQEHYSRKRCLIKCKEVKCGCSDPLRTIQPYEKNVAPPCSVTKLNCLRNLKLIEESCSCVQSCQKIIAITALENNRMNELHHTVNHIYAGINVSTSTVLSIRVRTTGSKVFNLVFNETWWSLLSSLGGVFNMFLGVGLFSALEILFLLIVKLPVAIRRSTEMSTSTVPVR